MALLGSLLVFSIFALNVGMGSFMGAAFLGDVGEMLMLVAASVLFVAAILKREADARRKARRDDTKGGNDLAS